jgi:hypothetical protein
VSSKAVGWCRGLLSVGAVSASRAWTRGELGRKEHAALVQKRINIFRLTTVETFYTYVKSLEVLQKQLKGEFWGSTQCLDHLNSSLFSLQLHGECRNAASELNPGFLAFSPSSSLPLLNILLCLLRCFLVPRNTVYSGILFSIFFTVCCVGMHISQVFAINFGNIRLNFCAFHA